MALMHLFRHRSRSCRLAGGFHEPLLLAAVALFAAGCAIIKPVPTPTPTPDPVPTSIIASGAFARPAISVAQDGSIHVAAEGPGMASLHLYTHNNGTWAGGEIVRGTLQTAKRVYVPNVLPGLVSFRYGPKDGGEIQGPGIYRAGKESFLGFSTGAARLALSKDGPILMSKDGIWQNLTTGQIGRYNAGLTGEKYAFVIDSSGIWHTAHNGSSRQASAVSIDGNRQTWASYETYPEQGDDLRYVDICAANGKTYISTVYGGDNRVQVMDAGRPRYSLDALPSLGKATMEQRCPPRLVATPKGVVAIWRSGKAIVAVNVEQALAGTAKPAQIATGEFPAAAVGPTGKIHLVYVSNGLHHKEIAL